MSSKPGWMVQEEEGVKETVQGWGRAKKLSAFGKCAAQVERALAKFPRRMWGFSPTPGVHWSIGEVIWHLADQEANLYLRLRKALAEPGGFVTAWDQEKWSKGLLYRKAKPEQ